MYHPGLQLRLQHFAGNEKNRRRQQRPSCRGELNIVHTYIHTNKHTNMTANMVYAVIVVSPYIHR